MSHPHYEPRFDQSKYRPVPAKPLRAKTETLKSCGKFEPEWKIPSKIDITVELDPNLRPTIGQLVGTVDLEARVILQEREQQRLKWEAERAEAEKPKVQAYVTDMAGLETKPEEPLAPKSRLVRIWERVKAFLS